MRNTSAPLGVMVRRRVSRHLSGGLTRSWIVQFLSAAAGRVQSGESFTLPLPPLESGGLRPSRHLPRRLGKGPAGPFPLPLTPRRLGEGACPPPCPLPEATPQSAAADSSPYTGEPKNDLQLRSGREGGAGETLVLIKGRGFSAGFRGRGACGGGLRWRGRRRARSW